MMIVIQMITNFVSNANIAYTEDSNKTFVFSVFLHPILVYLVWFILYNKIKILMKHYNNSLIILKTIYFKHKIEIH